MAAIAWCAEPPKVTRCDMQHDFEAVARELKNAVRGRLEATQVSELLVAKLGAAGSTSPFVSVTAGRMRESVDTLAAAHRLIQALADGKATLVEVGR